MLLPVDVTFGVVVAVLPPAAVTVAAVAAVAVAVAPAIAVAVLGPGRYATAGGRDAGSTSSRHGTARWTRG